MKKIKQANFVPQRLTQARFAKLYNMSELAEITGLTRAAISQFEKEYVATKPSPETLRLLANKLDVSERFFTKPLSEMETSVESTPSFRSRKTSLAKGREQARTYLKWMAYLIDSFKQFIHLPELKIPDFKVNAFEKLTKNDIEKLANQTRMAFNIGYGPISDVTLLLENHGIFIGHHPLQKKLDAISTWFDGRPIILINPEVSAVRIRYDLAHELGHFILHKNCLDEVELDDKNLHKTYEWQADYFAGCFLMPEQTFAQEVYSIDLESLIKLKERWKVSIASIIMRLENIHLISENQKQRLFRMLNYKSARSHEPLDSVIPKEKPRLFTHIIELLSSENVLKGWQLVEITALDQDFIKTLTAIPSGYFDNYVGMENVVSLRR